MRKFLFSITAYLVGVGSMAYFFWVVQFELDHAPEPFSWRAVLMDVFLFAIFPLQHSILPRPRIKSAVAQMVSVSSERSFYVLTSGLVMWLLLWNWRYFGPFIYHFENGIVFDIIFYVALALIIASTIALNHATMFGLKQGYLAWKGKNLPETGLQTEGLYGIVRHPITSLLIVALWSHKTLTSSRLLFNLLFTSYAILGTLFEERDLIKNFGSQYLKYREIVPGFIPRLSRRENAGLR